MGLNFNAIELQLCWAFLSLQASTQGQSGALNRGVLAHEHRTPKPQSLYYRYFLWYKCLYYRYLHYRLFPCYKIGTYLINTFKWLYQGW